MQPVFAYRQQSYPPRGPRWPQFGDEVLEDTLSVSEGAHRALSEKRQSMNDFHKENLVYHGLAHPMEEDRPEAPPPPEEPGPQAPDQRPPGSQAPSFKRPDLGPGPRGPQEFYIGGDGPEPAEHPDHPMEPAAGIQSNLGHPPDFPGGAARRTPRDTQAGPGGSMNPDVEMMSPSKPSPPPQRERVKRNRDGPYQRPEEEEELEPANGIMNLPFPMGPQAQAIEEDTGLSSSFVPKRRNESSPAPWPMPPQRQVEPEPELTPIDGVMELPYPTASSSSSSSSSSSPPPPPQNRKPPPPAPSVLTTQEEEESLEPINGVMELRIPRRLSFTNQSIW